MDNNESYINQGFSKNMNTDKNFLICQLNDLQKVLRKELIEHKKFLDEHKDIQVRSKNDKELQNI